MWSGMGTSAMSSNVGAMSRFITMFGTLQNTTQPSQSTENSDT